MPAKLLVDALNRSLKARLALENVPNPDNLPPTNPLIQERDAADAEVEKSFVAPVVR